MKKSRYTDNQIIAILKQNETGPADQAPGTSTESLPNQRKPIAAEIGIIAGNVSSDSWFFPLIPGDDDGKVSVERTKLKEMHDFWLIDSGHTFIMRNDQVIEQSVLFLHDGKFSDALVGE